MSRLLLRTRTLVLSLPLGLLLTAAALPAEQKPDVTKQPATKPAAKQQAGTESAKGKPLMEGKEEVAEWPYEGWTPLELSLFTPIQIFDTNHNVYGLRFNLIYGKSRNVVGLDLGFVNSSRHMAGLQLGLWNDSFDVYGFQLGLFGNIARGETGSFDEAMYKRYVDASQLKGSYESFPGVGTVLSRVSKLTLAFAPVLLGRADVYGFQLSLGVNSAGRVIGFQCCGILNSATGDLVGLQAGFFYNFASNVYGIQMSFAGLNRAEDLYGFQLNLIGWNMAVGRSIGIQASLLGNSAAVLYGIQIGFMNLAGGAGVQLGLVNFGRPYGGLQLSLYNKGGIEGVALGLVNEHELHMYGLAIALANSGGGAMAGIQLALLNNVTSQAAGLQLAGVFNDNRGDMSGAQLALLYNASKGMNGVQVSVLANSASRMSGLQMALGYNTASRMRGVQIAALNDADDAVGLQFGLINYARDLKGVQIGIINIHRNGLIFFPIINIGTGKAEKAWVECSRLRSCEDGAG